MSAEKRSFGPLSDGSMSGLYILTNSKGTEAAFTDVGAAWVSMKVADASGALRDVIIGYDSGRAYEENRTSCGECIGRNANRIGGASFTLGGTVYTLGKNDHEANNLHSGPDKWQNRVFRAETGDGKLGSYVRFSLSCPDGDQGYPGALEFSVLYTLSEDNELIIEYTGRSDKDTVFNPTNHAYFNLEGHASGSILGQAVWIDADRFTPTDSLSIPTGEIRDVTGTPMDFTVMKLIGQDIDADYEPLKFGEGYDHNFCLNRYDGSIRLAAKAEAPESGIMMKVYTDLPGLQFYTGNHLANQAPGKEGASYGPRAAYCFETQYYPDSVNKPEWPQPLLKAGEEKKSVTIYRFDLSREAEAEAEERKKAEEEAAGGQGGNAETAEQAGNAGADEKAGSAGAAEKAGSAGNEKSEGPEETRGE